MEIKNFTITKRDGSKDSFSLDKIMNAIIKAFDSVEEPADLGTISKIINHLDIRNDIKVEDIQNQVEEALMREGYYRVAKSFILYRQQHSEDREDDIDDDGMAAVLAEGVVVLGGELVAQVLELRLVEFPGAGVFEVDDGEGLAFGAFSLDVVVEDFDASDLEEVSVLELDGVR